MAPSGALVAVTFIKIKFQCGRARAGLSLCHRGCHHAAGKEWNLQLSVLVPSKSALIPAAFCFDVPEVGCPQLGEDRWLFLKFFFLSIPVGRQSLER